MRTIDLAVYADRLAGERVLLSARLDRCRARLCEAAIEREASAALDPGTMALLRVVGLLLPPCDIARVRAEMAEVTATLAALEQLQAWVECRLAAACAREPPGRARRSRPPPGQPAR